MRTAKYFAVIILIYTGVPSYSQSPNQFHSVESPNSTQLKGRVESPVSLNTGKAGVSIPLYAIQQKYIEIPIELSYSSNGVKLDMHPGWVGLNWNLRTGGSITRNVKGVPDEVYWRNDFFIWTEGDNQGTVIAPYGYFYNYPINGQGPWDSNQRITDLAKAGSEPNTLWVETEPDEYIFECGQYSGKFYLDHSGYFRVQGRPDIKVEAEIVYNIALFDNSTPLDIEDPSTFTSRDVAYYVSGPDGQSYPVYIFNRFRKAVIMGFRITTPDGLQYEFGKWGVPYNEGGTFSEVELSTDMFGQFLFDEIFTTWHLKKVIAPNNEFIEYFYQRDDPILQLGKSLSFYEAGTTPKGFLGFLFGSSAAFSQEPNWELSGRLIRPSYLSRIETNQATIEFLRESTTELRYNMDEVAYEIFNRSRFYNIDHAAGRYFTRQVLGDLLIGNLVLYPPGVEERPEQDEWYYIFRYDGLVERLYLPRIRWRQLDKIRIKSKSTNTVIKEWKFKYTNSTNERLQLLSLQEIGKSGVALPPYTFEYNKSYVLPGYNSLKTDHWGYFNNRLATASSDNAASLQNYWSLREPDTTYLYAGMLEQVTSPTGHVKRFVYEPNRYKAIIKRNTTTGAFFIESLPVEKAGGGLRIKQIIDKSGEDTPDMVTTYTYGDGLLMGDHQYYWPSYKGRLLNGTEYTSKRFVTESLLPVSENPGGGAVTYEQVTETKPGNGKTVYKYTGFYESPDVYGNSIDAQKSPYSPFISRSFERGLPKEVLHYSESDTLLSSEVYEYRANQGFNSDFIRAVYTRGTSLFGAGTVNVIEGTAYKHLLHPFQNVKKTSKVLDKKSGLYLTTVQDFSYDTDPIPLNDNQLKQVAQTNSNGDQVFVRYKHPLDFTVNNAVPELTGLNSLKEKFMWSKVIVEETRIRLAGDTELQTPYISYVLNTFVKTPKGFPIPKAIYRLGLNGHVTDHNNSINQSTFRLDSMMILDVSFDEYDTLGNLLQYTSRDGIPFSLLYGYKSTYPIAEIRNGTYQSVLSVLGQSVIDQLSHINPGTDEQVRNSLLPIRNSQLLSNAFITTYTYSPLEGMTSKTDPNNFTTYYERDALGRLILIKDHNQHAVKMFEYNYKIR